MRVLYVEDHPVNIEIMRAIFGLRPHLILDVAIDGASGLNAASRHTPDLLLLDLRLPDCHGTGLLAQLRALPALGHTPAIAASRSTASGKSTPSVSITKSKIEPFLPEEKSNHACFSSLTKNDGVFSCWNGDSPFHSRPAFFSFTRRPTTSDTGSRALRSSRNCGVKRMGREGSAKIRPPAKASGNRSWI